LSETNDNPAVSPGPAMRPGPASASGLAPATGPAGAAATGRRPAPRVFRLATLAVIVAVLALSAFADRSVQSHASAGVASGTGTGVGSGAGSGVGSGVAAAAMPVAAPGAALSSSWFCAGPAGTPARLADGRLVIANAGSRSLAGQVTLIPSTGPSVSQNVRVPSYGRLVVAEKLASAAPYLGAVVDLDGGQATVQQVISGTIGTSSTACANTGSTSWYFPTGTTQESSTLSISLLNPYPGDAIADLSFTTEQGQESPQDFQGVIVPAGTVVGLDLGTHLRRRASVATTVNLRVGRLVAFETQTVQAQSQAAAATAAPGTVAWPPGVSVTLGAPSAGNWWWWPSGAAGDGTTEEYVIYNPGSAAAQVSLAIDLDQGSADPFQVSVDPHGVAVVATNGESRIPKGIGHGATLHTTNGVGVVALRLVLATSPAGQTGVAEVLGSRMAAGRWLVPGDGTTDTVNPTVVVYNPGGAPVTVSISALDASGSPLDGQGAVAVPGHHRYLLVAPAPAPDRALMVAVHGTGHVVVENDTSPAKSIGIDAAVGVPLS
jgi:hypothetical protein